SIPMYAFAIVIWTFGEIAGAPVTPSILADLAPPELRGSYQGAFQMTWGAGSFLAPVIGSYVLAVAGEKGLWGGCMLVGFTAAAGFLVTPLRGYSTTGR
ncbi:MAG: MFS transporter, partial [Polyangiaceae bacterium]